MADDDKSIMYWAYMSGWLFAFIVFGIVFLVLVGENYFRSSITILGSQGNDKNMIEYDIPEDF